MASSSSSRFSSSQSMARRRRFPIHACRPHSNSIASRSFEPFESSVIVSVSWGANVIGEALKLKLSSALPFLVSRCPSGVVPRCSYATSERHSAASAAESFAARSLVAIVSGGGSWRNEAFGAPPSVNSADMRPDLIARHMVAPGLSRSRRRAKARRRSPFRPRRVRAADWALALTATGNRQNRYRLRLPYPRRADRGPVGEGPRKGRHSHRLLQPPAVDHRLSRLRLLARPPRHPHLRATPAKAAVVKMPK